MAPRHRVQLISAVWGLTAPVKIYRIIGFVAGGFGGCLALLGAEAWGGSV